jgi:hypothetical protein
MIGGGLWSHWSDYAQFHAAFPPFLGICWRRVYLCQRVIKILRIATVVFWKLNSVLPSTRNFAKVLSTCKNQWEALLICKPRGWLIERLTAEKGGWSSLKKEWQTEDCTAYYHYHPWTYDFTVGSAQGSVSQGFSSQIPWTIYQKPRVSSSLTICIRN